VRDFIMLLTLLGVLAAHTYATYEGLKVKEIPNCVIGQAVIINDMGGMIVIGDQKVCFGQVVGPSVIEYKGPNPNGNRPPNTHILY
jgi:hypothetical protein